MSNIHKVNDSRNDLILDMPLPEKITRNKGFFMFFVKNKVISNYYAASMFW